MDRGRRTDGSRNFSQRPAITYGCQNCEALGVVERRPTKPIFYANFILQDGNFANHTKSVWKTVDIKKMYTIRVEKFSRVVQLYSLYQTKMCRNMFKKVISFQYRACFLGLVFVVNLGTS